MTESFYLEVTTREGNPGRIKFYDNADSLDLLHAIEETALSQGLICKIIPAECIDPPEIPESLMKKL